MYQVNLLAPNTIVATVLVILLHISTTTCAQSYWQQKVDYKIAIDFDVKKHQYSGSETLVYTNESPDTLYSVYFHLYNNAFQPNSMMDVRSRTIADPDTRVASRISELGEDEIGFLNVASLSANGVDQPMNVSETVLEVTLTDPIPPKSSRTFSMQFDGQVPLQIRRSGRFNLGGVDYSMAQWFPKLAEYDKDGWHTSPYVGREFYAPWGNYDVSITIDKKYVLAGTGILQNPNDIGHGYQDEGVKVKHKGKTLTWNFKAENVHDFVWAADPDYSQTTAQVPGGPLLRFFYIPGEETKEWKKLPEYTVKAFQFVEANYGKYGWDEYHIIQGGDGGMEYPMATLIANKKTTGVRSLQSLVGVTIHELIHSWYQGMLATNESYYAWMDEGFTTYASAYASAYVWDQEGWIMGPYYQGYYGFLEDGEEEALTTHADHFNTNAAYSSGSYTKGAVALEQLSYVIGNENLKKGLLKYYHEWAFKHPDLKDFIRVMEKQSGIQLDWYFDYWIATTHTIDYNLKEYKPSSTGTSITLERIGKMPMPVDLFIKKKDGSLMLYYIPLDIMRGEKSNETQLERQILRDWAWTHPTYSFEIEIPLEEIEAIAIDATGRMADINYNNNFYSREESDADN